MFQNNRIKDGKMNFTRFPRRKYIQHPTPIEPLPRLSRVLGDAVSLYVKRDDLLPGAAGGNKTRKLEFNETTLLDVVRDLNHTYQSDITILDNELSDLTITVSFNKQELDAVLNVLASTLDLVIKKNGDQITIEAED